MTDAELTVSLARAVVGALVASRVTQPFVVRLTLDRHGSPVAFAGSAAFRNRLLSRGGTVDETVRMLPSLSPPDGALLDVDGHLDDATREACELLGRLTRAAIAGESRSRT